MPQNFLACDREQSFLMPPSLREWLAGDELAWCVLDAVAEFDLSAIYGAYRADGHGAAAFDPGMMVGLLLYAYAVGERSSRGIERRCRVDVAFRVIAANQQPDHATIARFRARHEDALAGLFPQVLRLCARAGLVSLGVIALDSTQLAANASGQANRTYEQIAAEILAEAGAVDAAEDELFGEARGDELPPELADPASRQARLREAKRQLEAEHEAAQRAHEEKLQVRAEREAQTGRKVAGRKPQPPPERIPPDRRINLTDRESRPVRTKNGFIQGYGVQAVATAEQIIIAAEVQIGATDQGLLEPMIDASAQELKAAGVREPIQTVVADAGYWKTEQIHKLQHNGIQVLVPPDGQTDGKRGDPRRQGDVYDEMREALDTDPGSGLYRQRMCTIEPIFGHTKHNRRADRFQRRGRAACRSEWRLITATHNLLKLWRATSPGTALA
jgi:transposase